MSARWNAVMHPSFTQKITLVATVMLAILSRIYVPFEIPNPPGEKYSWIWNPPRYVNQLDQEVWDLVDREEIGRILKPFKVDPKIQMGPAERAAMVDFAKRRITTYSIIVCGIVFYCLLGLFQIKTTGLFRS